jgi:hypothetical protein
VNINKSFKEKERKLNLITGKNKKIYSNIEFFEQFSDEINRDNMYDGKNLKIFFSKK